MNLSKYTSDEIITAIEDATEGYLRSVEVFTRGKNIMTFKAIGDHLDEYPNMLYIMVLDTTEEDRVVEESGNYEVDIHGCPRIHNRLPEWLHTISLPIK